MPLTSVYAITLPGAVFGHGLFYTPKSRAQLAQEAGSIGDATSIIAEPMPDVASGRDYPGGRPFAEPGQSVSNVGPCGRKDYGGAMNWNMPDVARGWGSVQATYSAGEIATVEWCVSDAADHGGLYSYRMCSDESITAKFIDPAHTPTAAEEAALEACFQEGILSCTDVPGQSCPVHSECQNGWGCAKATSWFTCGPKDSGRCKSKGVGKCQCHNGDGSLLRDQVRMPNFVSNHTLLGFRWDSEDTAQLWMNCADVALVDGPAPPTPPTPPSPVPPAPSDQCDLSDSDKRDCGHTGSQQGDCEANGCCWKPAGEGSNTPWCFWPKASHLTV
jgi:hypothetical protein